MRVFLWIANPHPQYVLLYATHHCTAHTKGGGGLALSPHKLGVASVIAGVQGLLVQRSFSVHTGFPTLFQFLEAKEGPSAFHQR